MLIHGLPTYWPPMRLGDVNWRFLHWQSARLPAADPPPGTIQTLSHEPTEHGWQQLWAADFENVNDEPGTWTWTEGQVHCTGKLPPGGIEVQVLVVWLDASPLDLS